MAKTFTFKNGEPVEEHPDDCECDRCESEDEP